MATSTPIVVNVDQAVEALFESVRTLAALQQEATHTAWLHARNAGHEQLARRLAGVEGRIGELIAEELTWPEDKEVVDAFGELG